MNPFDKIIGYDAVKNELIRMADVLAHPDVYAALGVTVPKGLLLHGDPGVGKTLMVNSLIEASGLPSFICRRDTPDGDFVLKIKGIFDDAAKKTPAIVFLDDLDKFAKSEEDSFNQEEFVAVQAAIDNLNGKKVFVVATANDIDFLPPSLVRPGRFDKTLRIHNPSGQEAVEIIQHYLSGKPLEDDIDVSYIAKLLQNQSCAVLETAVNAAGVLAGFNRANRISMHHFVLGCLETVHEIPASMVIKGKMNLDNDLLTHIACHEAGHAVVSEILSPGSVTMVCIHELCNHSHGFTSYYRPQKYGNGIDRPCVVAALAGRAALDMCYGIIDEGARSDLDYATNEIRKQILYTGAIGFSFLSVANDSEALNARVEFAISEELERSYSQAKMILAENRAFHKAITDALMRDGLLTSADIQKIKDNQEF